MGKDIQKLDLSKDENEIAEYPEKQQKDYFRDLLKIPVSLIPTGNSILDLVFTSPLSKRKDAWAKELGEKVQEILDTGMTVENLQNNEKFIDAVFQATQIAVKTSQKEKIESLKNAIKNTVLDDSLDESFIQISLNLIDELTPIHLKLLKFFFNHSETEVKGRSIVKHGRFRWRVDDENFQSLSDEEFDYYMNKLETERLIIILSDSKTISESGEKFLKFISSVEL